MGQRSRLGMIRNKQKIIVGFALIGVIAFLFSPLPGIEAVTLTLSSSTNPALASTGTVTEGVASFAIEVKKTISGDAGVGSIPETISEDSTIHVIIDENTTDEQTCVFSLDAKTFKLTPSDNCSGIASLDLLKIEDSGASGYQYFGYGYFYSYGNSYSNSGYFNKLIGDGSRVYGLTADLKNDDSTAFVGDVTATYEIKLTPLGLSDGTHDLNVKVFDPDDSMFFVPSSAVSFTNTLPASTDLKNAYKSGITQNFKNGRGGIVLPASTANAILNIDFTFDGDSAAAVIKTLNEKKLKELGTRSGATKLIFAGPGFDLDLPDGACPCTLTITYDPDKLPPGLQEKVLKLFHFVGGKWEILDTTVDTNANTLTATFTSLSPAGIGGTSGGGTSSTGRSSSSGGSGSVGGSGGGGGGSVSSAELEVSAATIYDISYEVCEENMVRVVAGPDVQGLGGKLRTSISGVITMDRAEEQPLSGRVVFEASVAPGETFALVQIEGVAQRGASIAQHSVDFTECSGSIKVNDYVPPTAPTLVTPTKPFVGSAPTIQGGETFETTYSNLDFSVSYKAQTSGTITGIEIDENAKSVTFSLEDVGAGEFLLSVPRTLVDAFGDNFVMLVEASPEEQIDYEIVDSTEDYVTFKIMMPEGATALTLVGTAVVPEFGTIAIAVFAVTVLGIVALARYSKFSIPKTA